MSMNNVQLIGRLTQDPVINYNAKGTCIAQLTLAVDRSISKEQIAAGQQKVDFIPCIAFDKLAEQIGNNVSKGMRLLVNHGRLCINKYQDKDGKNRYHTEVRIYGIDYVEYKNSSMGTPVELEENVFF